MSPILGIWASQISGHLWAPAGAYDALATITVPSGGVASVTFAGIPTGYKHLQIRANVQTDTASTLEDFTLYLNGDTTGSNYYSHRLWGNGASASAQGFAGGGGYYIYQGVVAGASATNTFAGLVVDILDYANTNKNKTVRTLGGVDLNGSGQISLASGLWQSTAAVNSITFIIPNTAKKITQYSSFALYGIK